LAITSQALKKFVLTTKFIPAIKWLKFYSMVRFMIWVQVFLGLVEANRELVVFRDQPQHFLLRLHYLKQTHKLWW